MFITARWLLYSFLKLQLTLLYNFHLFTVIYHQFLVFHVLNHSNPKNDQHLISPYSKTAESFTKIMRMKEMLTNLRSFDLQMNSICQYQKKHIE